MNLEQFELHLIEIRDELNTAFKHGEVSETDVILRATLEHQHKIALALGGRIDGLYEFIFNAKSEILKDNKERFALIMEKLEEIKK